MNGLPDYLDRNLKILFVGYNPGERSALLGHHFAGRGNQFWRLLYDAGLTKRLYPPEEDDRLLAEGYGLTNLVVRPSKSSSDLSAEEMRAGAAELRLRVEQYQPRVVCFLGKEVYRKYARLTPRVVVAYGLVKTAAVFPAMKEFIAPNPSGRSTILYREKLAVFCQLRELIEMPAL